MDLYAKRTAYKPAQQQKTLSSTGQIDADIKELKFSLTGAMGWTALILAFIIVFIVVLGKYGKNIKSFFSKERRTARRKARAARKKRG